MDNMHKLVGSSSLLNNLALIRNAASINKLASGFNSYNSTLNLLNSANWSHKIGKSYHVNSAINTIIGKSNFWTNYHSPHYFHLNKFERAVPKIPEFTAIMGFSAAIKKIEFANYINTTFQNAKLDSILWKHNQQLNILTNFKYNGQIKQLESVMSLFNGITASIAIDAVQNDDEENLDLIENIVDRIANTTSEIYEQGYITKEDVVNITERILDYFKSIKKDTWVGIIAGMLVSLLISFMTPAPTLKLPENAASKQDIQYLFKAISDNYIQGIESKGISKRLASNVLLRVGASDTSYQICSIKSGTIVTVLDLSSKWAYISFEDSATGLPNCGWISSNHFVQHPFVGMYKQRGKNTRINNTPLKSR